MNKEFNSSLLMTYITRIEKLNDDAEQLSADLKEVYEEAKNMGYDTKMMRKMIALRKLDQEELYELDELTELYRKAVGL